MSLNAREKKERSALIAELTRLSYIGWDKCIREDWEPLEKRLAELNAKKETP